MPALRSRLLLPMPSFFCHFEDNPAILTLLSLLNALFKGVCVKTEDISIISKARTDSRG